MKNKVFICQLKVKFWFLQQFENRFFQVLGRDIEFEVNTDVNTDVDVHLNINELARTEGIVSQSFTQF